jgi:hypothetical protein
LKPSFGIIAEAISPNKHKKHNLEPMLVAVLLIPSDPPKSIIFTEEIPKSHLGKS